jgi:hypothetical protein
MCDELQKTIRDTGFGGIFTEVEHPEKLGLKNREELRLFYLKITDNMFDLDDLSAFLRKTIGRYVFSRAKMEEFRKNGDLESVVSDASRIIKRECESGEASAGSFGGVMLYVFLEQVLGAPKILSKVELVTEEKQHRSKCDGIHLLSFKDGGIPCYHMIFGTSSVVGDLGYAIDGAFDAVVKIEAHAGEEKQLTENTLFEKIFDANTAKRIRDLIVPAKDPRPVCDTAYGIFLCYSLGLDVKRRSSSEHRTAVTIKMRSDIEHYAPYIVEKINALGLANHSFYFYIMPLNDVDKEQLKMMEEITE